MTMTLNRRKFLQRIYQVVIAAGAAPLLSFDELLAADANVSDTDWSRPNLVWLQGASCSGCSTSFLNVEQITILDFLSYFTRLIYHPNLSAASGDQVPQILNKLAASNKPYILVMEGAIPAGMPHTCMMAHQPIGEWVSLLAAKASICIAGGTCAASGGIAKMAGTLTGAESLDDFLKQRGIKTPSVNLPSCPMHPDHLVYTLLHFIKSKALPELDDARRPRRFFSHSVHDSCPRYAAFQARDFARRIGDEGCLMELGCQGPVTYNDCIATGYNGNTNNCIRAGHPCIGCASELFPRPLLYHTHDPGTTTGDILKKSVK
jgi:hydrogenase small subunit